MARSTLGRNRGPTGTPTRGGWLYERISNLRSQVGWRARNDDGDETTATWKAAENTNWSQTVDENFRIRFVIDEMQGGDPSSADYKYQYNLNGAGWNDVTATSLVVRASASGGVANGTATTRQLFSGAGSFRAGAVDTNNGAFGLVDLNPDEFTELEGCAQVRSADVANNDTIQLRVFDNTTGLALDAYSHIPTITVIETAAQTVTLDALVAAATVPALTRVDLMVGPLGAITPGATLGDITVNQTVTLAALTIPAIVETIQQVTLQVVLEAISTPASAQSITVSAAGGAQSVDLAAITAAVVASTPQVNESVLLSEIVTAAVVSALEEINQQVVLGSITVPVTNPAVKANLQVALGAITAAAVASTIQQFQQTVNLNAIATPAVPQAITVEGGVPAGGGGFIHNFIQKMRRRKEHIE